MEDFYWFGNTDSVYWMLYPRFMPRLITSALKKLNTPEKIQTYLDSIPFNYEKDGETCMSPTLVFKHKKAHCMEGAMLAAAALMQNGHKPLIMSLKVKDGDYDHVVALYKQNGYWGAISKTNHAVLRYRDPIYKTIRELALSYFHEYFLTKTGEKTLKGYSMPINLNKFGKKWLDSETDLWHIAETIYDGKHIPIVPKQNQRSIRDATLVERKAASIRDW